LVNQCAKKGKGKSAFISDEEDVVGAIVTLLEASITPCLN